MKKRVLKALACSMAVCMAAASLAGCGNQSSGGSSAAQGSSESSSTPSSESGGASSESSSEAPVEETDPNENLFPAYDLGGQTLTLLKHNSLANLDPESVQTTDENGNTLDEKVKEKEEKQKRKEEIEAKYNVKIEFVDLPTQDWDYISQEIILNWTNGTPVADIMDAYSSFGVDYIVNGILYDFTADYKASPIIKETNHLNWRNSETNSPAKWGVRSGQGGWGIYYNKDWLNKLGMEKTPAEMFAEGKWSYADALAYMKDVQNKLGEGEYAFYAAPWYWLILAPGGNGTAELDLETGRLLFADDPFIEVCQFYADCMEEGVMPKLPKDENGSWYYLNDWADGTFASNNTVVIAQYGWKAPYINDKEYKFELGFVPYPWGSNVTIDKSKVGQSDAYLTLSENYGANYYDSSMLVMTKGIEKKVKPMEAMGMMLEWLDWKWMLNDYVEENKENTSGGWLEDGLDKDLYHFSLSREKWDAYTRIPVGDGLGGTYTFYEGKDFRSQLWARYNSEQQILIDEGYADPSVYHPFEIPAE